MLRLGFATLAVISTLATAAVAQSMNTQATGASAAQPSKGATSNPAITHKPADSSQTTGTVEPGANSFTEAQARSRIEAQGFRNVVELSKDDQGVWRGQAERDGKSVSVAIDYKGTVQAQ